MCQCKRADETQKHWLFSCTSSQDIFIYLLCLLVYIDINQVIDNTVEDCLLYPKEEEIELVKNKLREHFYFIYNVVKIQQTEEDYL